MSVILASGDQITKHQLNSSTAKQSFLFSKSTRFKTEADKYHIFLLDNDKQQFYLVVINSLTIFQALKLTELVVLAMVLNTIFFNINISALHQMYMILAVHSII